MEKETVEIVSMKGLDIYQAEKAAIDMQIATAKAFPRNRKKAKDNVISLITLDKSIAEKCNYSLPTANKILQGPSVRLAKMLAKNWGNLRIDARIGEVELKYVTAEAVAFDLENNYAVRIQVSRSIWGTNGRFSDHMIEVTKQAAIAIAFRNAVFQIIDEEVIEMCYNAAKKMVVGNVSDEQKLKNRRKIIFDGLKETYGVTEKEALSVIKKSSIDDVTADDIFILTGLITTLQTGEISADQMFRGKSVMNGTNDNDKTEERLLLLIKNSKDVTTLNKYKSDCKNPTTLKAWDEKFSELKEKK